MDEQERLARAIDAIKRVQDAASKAAQEGQTPPEERLPEGEGQQES